MRTRPRISVIIPHYNDLEHLDECLAALENQTLPRDQYEIIVADNNSSCGIDAVVACVGPRGRVTLCREQGAGPARNAGVAIAEHPILAFTDSDCVVEPQWLEAGVDALKHADIIGGRVRVSVRNPGWRSGPEAFESVFAFDFRRYIEKLGFTGSGNLFTSREVFDAVGGFRSSVSEDKDWSHRAVAAGYRLRYEQRAAMAHPARVTWDELWRKWYRLQRESFALAKEEQSGKLRWWLRSLVLPVSIVVHAPRIFTSTELDNLSERMRALGVLIKLRIWRFMDAQTLMFGPQ